MTVPRAFKAYLDVEEQKRKREKRGSAQFHINSFQFQFISFQFVH